MLDYLLTADVCMEPALAHLRMYVACLHYKLWRVGINWSIHGCTTRCDTSSRGKTSLCGVQVLAMESALQTQSLHVSHSYQPTLASCKKDLCGIDLGQVCHELQGAICEKY